MNILQGSIRISAIRKLRAGSRGKIRQRQSSRPPSYLPTASDSFDAGLKLTSATSFKISTLDYLNH
jgi:hypothetical protein